MASSIATELLATCNSLGYSEGDTYFREPDCLVSLKDLIRFLKRDDKTHEVRRLLGDSKVLQTDFVPIMKTFPHDKEMFDIILRLLVNLTTPALIVYDEEIPVECTGRKQYLEVVNHLQGYKEYFCDEVIWVVLCEKLRDLLKLEWENRLEDDRLLLERILIVVRNVLHVPYNPAEEQRADGDATVHDRILWGLHKSGLEDLILFMANSEDLIEFNLHTLEIITLMFRDQNAEDLSSAGLSRSHSEKQKDENELLEIRRREQASRQANTSKYRCSRHSRFGGTFTVKDMKSISDRELIVHRPLTDLKSLDFGPNKPPSKKRRGQVLITDVDTSRRSTLSIRLFLKEFCVEFLNSAYNSIMSNVKDQLARKRTQDHDETYYLWALRFFMEFNRLHDFHVELISETMSIATFHFVQTHLDTYQEMMTVDKKKIILWSRRMHLALKAYQELLVTLTAMDTSKDPVVCDSAKIIKTNIFYTLEYRELPYTLLHQFSEFKHSRTYLKDLVEMTHVFLKLLDKHCKKHAHVIVQRKRRKQKKKQRVSKDAEKDKSKVSKMLTEEQLDDLWTEMAYDLSETLNRNALETFDDIIPFDAASEVPIEEQKGVAIQRIQGFLRSKLPKNAVFLFRASRDVWPENDCFGASNIESADEFLALREVFYAKLPEGPIMPTDNAALVSTSTQEVSVDEYDEIESEEEDEGLQEAPQEASRAEQEFDLKGFVARFATAKVVKTYCLLFKNWAKNSAFTNHCIIKMFHRFAWDCKAPAILFQATLFRDFQAILNNPGADSSPDLKEMVQFIKFILRRFFEVASKNKTVFIELLFWKGLRDAHEIEDGYDSHRNQSKSGVKHLWTEDMDTELKYLYNEYKDKHEIGKDIVDLIMDHFSDSSKTRRQIINQLKYLDILKDTKELQRQKRRNVGNLRLPKDWSEEEVLQLRELYNKFEEADDIVGRILDNLTVKRPKRRVVQKLLELGIVSDKKQLRKKTKRNRKTDKEQSNKSGAVIEEQSDSDDESRDHLEESSGDDDSDSEVGSASEDNIINRSSIPRRSVGNIPSAISKVDLLELLKTAMSTEDIREAVEWVRDDLIDIAKDKLEEGMIGSVPLVPILEETHRAIEQPIFVKLLKALGLSPPVDEQESFWRYPETLSAEMCQYNVEILNQALRGDYNIERSDEDSVKNQPNDDVDISINCGDTTADLNSNNIGDYAESDTSAIEVHEQTTSIDRSDDDDDDPDHVVPFNLKSAPMKRKNFVLDDSDSDESIKEKYNEIEDEDEDDDVVQVSKKTRKIIIESDSE